MGDHLLKDLLLHIRCYAFITRGCCIFDLMEPPALRGVLLTLTLLRFQIAVVGVVAFPLHPKPLRLVNLRLVQVAILKRTPLCRRSCHDTLITTITTTRCR